MNTEYTSDMMLADFVASRTKNKRILLSITLEITARCNNNCRHCYINLPEKDLGAIKGEMSFNEITRTIDEAAMLGALWCSFTGGEPLLRDDFFNLYLYAKKKGFLTSVLTNATLITDKHVELFKKYPPRNLEISVYGVTKKIYERVSGIKGSFKKFETGINKLIDNNIPISLKAPALKSNIKEYKEMVAFCKKHSREGYVRFDPQVFLRTDNNHKRNKLIISERVPAKKLKELKELHLRDNSKSPRLDEKCLESIPGKKGKKAFSCHAGTRSCKITHNAHVTPCEIFYHPEALYNLRKGSLSEAWNIFIPKINKKYFQGVNYPAKCYTCNNIENCSWCPAHACLENKKLNQISDVICDLADYF